MVKEKDIINPSFWTNPYLTYVIWTQIYVCLKMCVFYTYKCQTYFLMKERHIFHKNMSIYPELKYETWNVARDFSVYFFIHLAYIIYIIYIIVHNHNIWMALNLYLYLQILH